MRQEKYNPEYSDDVPYWLVIADWEKDHMNDEEISEAERLWFCQKP